MNHCLFTPGDTDWVVPSRLTRYGSMWVWCQWWECVDVQEEDKDSRKKAVAASLGGVATADGTDERADEEVSNKSFFPLLLHYKLIFTVNFRTAKWATVLYIYLTRWCNIDTYLQTVSLIFSLSGYRRGLGPWWREWLRLRRTRFAYKSSHPVTSPLPSRWPVVCVQGGGGHHCWAPVSTDTADGVRVRGKGVWEREIFNYSNTVWEWGCEQKPLVKDTSLYRTLGSAPHTEALVYYITSEYGTSLNSGHFDVPKVSLIQRFHCMYLHTYIHTYIHTYREQTWRQGRSQTRWWELRHTRGQWLPSRNR